MTGVNPFRGFMGPAFRANRIEAHRELETRFFFDTHAAKFQCGWADEASSRTHPGRAKIDQISQKRFPIDQGREGPVGKALEEQAASAKARRRASNLVPLCQ